MKLYLIYWDDWELDQYSHAVVVAQSEEEARNIHPHGQNYWDGNLWAKKPTDITAATYIGEAADNLNSGEVICASFHAG